MVVALKSTIKGFLIHSFFIFVKEMYPSVAKKKKSFNYFDSVFYLIFKEFDIFIFDNLIFPSLVLNTKKKKNEDSFIRKRAYASYL